MDTLEYITKKYNLNLKLTKEDKYVVIPDVRRRDLAKLFAELNFRTGAEIGVMRGKYSEEICQNNPQVKLYAIDSWMAYKEYGDFVIEKQFSDFYNDAVRSLSKYNCKIIRKSSMEAVKDFKDESLDFVYIDANHTLKYVVEDIVEWAKKVRKDGIVAGHDFILDENKLVNCHVYYALNAYIASYKIDYVFILGKRRSKNRDYILSWFFIKQ